MTRFAFGLTVAALVALLGALLFADMIGLGFQSEGCRNIEIEGRRRALLFDLLIMQGMFGLFYALLVAGLAATLRARTGSAPYAKWIVIGAAALFVAVTAVQALFLATCGGGAQWIQVLRSALQFFALAALLLTVAGILWATIRGLRQ